MQKRPGRAKKIVLICICAVLVLFLSLAAGFYFLFKPQLETIASVKRLQERFYTMEYAGDYGFREFLDAGGAGSSAELAAFLSNYISKGFYTHEMQQMDFGCSTVSAVSPEGHALFGRNFDWQSSSCMIVKTAPSYGYKSISTVNLDFLGYGEGYQPDGLANSFLALGAAFVPLDGMNEKGLCVADLVIENAGETHQDMGKPDLTTTAAIRLLLDYAGTVDEAIALLSQYDMHSDIGTMHHLSIADASGRAVVVEYIDDAMQVTETRVVTNHFIWDMAVQVGGSEFSHERFETLDGLLDLHGGVLDEEQVKQGLMAVAQSMGDGGKWHTQWSIVYDQTGLSLDFYRLRGYGDPLKMAIE